MSQKTEFRLPGPEDRTVIIGATGTGKTVFGAWVLSRQNFQKRPWVWLDFKNEELCDTIGDPPMRDLRVGAMPAKTGLYRLRVRPDQEEALEGWLWKVWAKENIGIFCDEVSLIPKGKAFKAVLRQGRSKRIPVIACTQRPVDCDREVFTESQYTVVFRVKDARDYKTIREFAPEIPLDRPLPPHHSYWYDTKQNALFTLNPCPPPDIVAATLRNKTPYSWFLAR